MICSRFTIYLLTQLGFYLDLTANSDLPSDVEMVYSYRKNIVQQSQFIHQSGTVIVSILPNDEGLSTSLNRNFISHQSLELLEIGEIVMKELRRVCDDEKELIKIWDCAKEIEL